MYKITINIADRGTILNTINPTTGQIISRGGDKSSSGHMWVTLTNEQGKQYHYGFRPQSNEGLNNFRDDGRVDSFDPARYQAFTQESVEISKEAFETAKKYGDQSLQTGWDTYNLATLNCVDYTYEMMRQAKIRMDYPTEDGLYMPQWNKGRVKEIVTTHTLRLEEGG